MLIGHGCAGTALELPVEEGHVEQSSIQDQEVDQVLPLS